LVAVRSGVRSGLHSSNPFLRSRSLISRCRVKVILRALRSRWMSIPRKHVASPMSRASNTVRILFLMSERAVVSVEEYASFSVRQAAYVKPPLLAPFASTHAFFPRAYKSRFLTDSTLFSPFVKPVTTPTRPVTVATPNRVSSSRAAALPSTY
jgi:hypothetical protein